MEKLEITLSLFALLHSLRQRRIIIKMSPVCRLSGGFSKKEIFIKMYNLSPYSREPLVNLKIV